MANQRIRIRHHHIDWLRITAFMLLIFYHAGRAFFPEDPWHINDPVGSWPLRIAMDDFLARWRLPLLFFVSGIGTHFLLARRTLGKFLVNRFVRLFVPLGFAMLLIVSPQVWLERTFNGQTEQSFLSWLLSEGFTQGNYPEGNISWHHMWYIAYLFVMTLLLTPFLVAWARNRFAVLQRLVARLSASNWLVAAFLLPLAAQLTLGIIWPGKSNGLFGDWGWLSICASWFLLGFVFGAHLDAFSQTARRLRWWALGGWAVLMILVFALPGSDNFSIPIGDGIWRWGNAFTIPIAWLAIISLTGFFYEFINFDSPAKRYLNEAVYPLYIVHQTIALAVVFLVVPLDWAVWSKFLIVTLVTFLGSFLLYHFVIRHLGWGRILFGLARR